MKREINIEDFDCQNAINQWLQDNVQEVNEKMDYVILRLLARNGYDVSLRVCREPLNTEMANKGQRIEVQEDRHGNEIHYTFRLQACSDKGEWRTIDSDSLTIVATPQSFFSSTHEGDSKDGR